MLTKQIDIKEAQVRFQELLAEVLSGVEWVLTDGTTPIARLVQAGMWVSEDIRRRILRSAGETV